jgi:hypothetical protein
MRTRLDPLIYARYKTITKRKEEEDLHYLRGGGEGER